MNIFSMQDADPHLIVFKLHSIPTITDLKEPNILICYGRTSVTANM